LARLIRFYEITSLGTILLVTIRGQHQQGNLLELLLTSAFVKLIIITIIFFLAH